VELLDDQFLQWAYYFDATSLKNNPKFQVI
jgi:hypothetical protein